MALPDRVNNVLNVKKEKWTASEAVCSFEQAAGGLQRVPELDPPDPATEPVPFGVSDEVGAEIVGTSTGITPSTNRLSRSRSCARR